MILSFKPLIVFALTGVLSGYATVSAMENTPAYAENGAVAQSAARAKLVTDVVSESTPEKSVIRIVADSPFEYISYRLDNPDRVAVEIEGAMMAMESSMIPVDDELVSRVTLIPFVEANTVRVEIWLKKNAVYETSMVGATLTVAVRPEVSPALAEARKKLELAKHVIEERNKRISVLNERIKELEAQLGKEKASKTETSTGARGPEADDNEAAPQETDREGVVEALSGWLSAWRTGDIAGYADYYDESFSGGGAGRKAWLRSKREKFQRAGDIEIKVEDLEISANNKEARAEFLQKYSSDRYKDVGIKTLTMIKTGDGWKITREVWRPVR